MVHVTRASGDSAQDWEPLLVQGCAPGLDGDLARRVLHHLVRGPEAVIELRGAAQLRLLAAVVDTCVNAHDVASLEVVAGQPAELAHEVVDEVLALAESIVADGPRRALDIEVDTHRDAWTPVLEERSYRTAYAMHELGRDLTRADASARTAPPLGWRWRELGPSDAQDYHRLLLRAFQSTPGAFVPSREELRRWLRSTRARPEVLVCEFNRPIGWVFVTSGPAGGVVRNLGRDPDVRGRGIGDLLLRRGLQRLAQRDLASVRLEVAGDNEAGHALYARHGFEPVGSRPVMRRVVGD